VTEQDLLTPDEVATLFRVHAETARRWMKTGQIPAARKIGGLWFVSRQRLDEWLQSRGEEFAGDGHDVPPKVGRPLGGGDLEGTEGSPPDDRPVRAAKRQHPKGRPGAARGAKKPRAAEGVDRPDDRWVVPSVVARRRREA
jgi:excisionase family DNA binding protein